MSTTSTDPATAAQHEQANAGNALAPVPLHLQAAVFSGQAPLPEAAPMQPPAAAVNHSAPPRTEFPVQAPQSMAFPAAMAQMHAAFPDATGFQFPILAPSDDRSPGPSRSGGRKRRRAGPKGRRRSGSEDWTPSGAEGDASVEVAGDGTTAGGSSSPDHSNDGASIPGLAGGGSSFQRGCGNPVVQVSRELKQSFDAHVAEQLRQCTISVTEGGPEHVPVLGRVLQLACHALRDMLDKKVVTATHIRAQFGEFQAVCASPDHSFCSQFWLSWHVSPSSCDSSDN